MSKPHLEVSSCSVSKPHHETCLYLPIAFTTKPLFIISLSKFHGRSQDSSCDSEYRRGDIQTLSHSFSLPPSVCCIGIFFFCPAFRGVCKQCETVTRCFKMSCIKLDGQICDFPCQTSRPRLFYLGICIEFCYYKYNITKHCNKSHLF